MRNDAKIETARRFRRNLTKSELWLWARLKARSPDAPVFRRQHPIGPYILDFYCAKARLCVEVDGEVHEYHDKMRRDQIRDAWLIERDIQVHRIVAADLMADPDDAAAAAILLARQRMAKPT
ncbi:hypothetical protein ABAC460_02830 [Asticcacaulis sp. AC460]|uniref:endonuclease domain-containing protein n=1 Tax=Asticcacaulis sp. AC460 TaxID=1282360 RepID=UPI0003C3DACF|nr:DUF559 domain-containing protein [Asticcacaulis sp. AC460]ESQ92785.1 hypothetical protein ABAC460_02830 [Asticcacaulis sp. AC460]